MRRVERALRTLKAGQAATIARVTGSTAHAKRLADMGFISGARVEMVRPGAPCLVRIGGTWIGLGQEHQQGIYLHVAPLPPEPATERP